MILSSAARQFRAIAARTSTIQRCASAIFPPPASASLASVTIANSPISQTNQTHASLFSTSAQKQPSIASLVKQLRELTGAPMMECKKALSAEEVQNDLTKATEWLRKYGSAKASSKVAGREALEGLVGLTISNERGLATLVKVASETDFASRSETFSSFVQGVADAAATETSASSEGQVADIPNFLSTAKNNEGKLLSEGLNDAILAIRENIQVSSISVMKASSDSSVFAGYVHGRAPNSTCGTSAAIVEVASIKDSGSNDDDKARWEEVAKKLAMHVVAAKPIYLNPDSVPEEVVSKEKEILREKMGASNKPPEILEKIITGQLRKFYEGICLTEQAHMVEEGNPKISKLMKDLGLQVKTFELVGMTKS